MTHRPHRPRHRSSKAAYGPYSVSSALLPALLAACLLGAALCLGGLLAGPFG